MTQLEYNDLNSGDLIYSFNIYQRNGKIDFSSINANIDINEICEPYFKNPTLGFSFRSDTTHLCIDTDSKDYYFLDKNEALFHKINAIRKVYLDVESQEIKLKMKKFFKQKNVLPIIIKHYPELLI